MAVVWLTAAARLLQYAGAVVLFGAPLFLLYGPRGEDGRRAVALAWPRFGLALAAVVILAGGVLGLALEAAAMTDKPADVFRPAAWWDVLTGSRFGAAMGVRLILTTLALPLTLAPAGHGPRIAQALTGAAVMVSFAWTGHGAMDEGMGGLAHLGSDIIHLLAAGVWLGALAGLVTLTMTRRLDDDPGALMAVQRALEGFSGVGSLMVALLVLTGLVNGVFLIGLAGISRLPTSAYGLLLLAKIAAFFVMMGLAVQNRFRLTPALSNGLATGDAVPARRALARSIGIESAVAGLVLALVGALGALAPLSMPG